MRRHLIILALATLMLAMGGLNAQGQSAQPSPAATTDAGITANGVIGEVTAIDAGARHLTVKTDAGASVTVTLNEKTAYLRLAPGEKTLTNAVKIQLTDVAVGDRVWARGRVAEDQRSVPAIALVVMTKADIARKQEHDRAEWRRRGVAGIVTALNPETKEITLSMRGRGEATPIIISTAGSVDFRRYAPDSVRFSDARPSSFAELKVGDQLRALGERSADGTHFTPEEIVSGSFRTIGGSVTAVNAGANEIKLKDIQTGQSVTVVVSHDSLLRRLPPEMAARLAARSSRGARAGGGDETANASGAPRREQQQQQGARPSGQGGEGRPSGGGPGRWQNGEGRRGGFDFQEMLEHLPALSIDELKTGDMVIVSSTVGTEASRVTAIKLVAGVDELLNAAQRRPGRQGGGGGVDSGAGFDSGPIDFGIGLP
jgi:hypothetical protein